MTWWCVIISLYQTVANSVSEVNILRQDYKMWDSLQKTNWFFLILNMKPTAYL